MRISNPPTLETSFGGRSEGYRSEYKMHLFLASPAVALAKEGSIFAFVPYVIRNTPLY